MLADISRFGYASDVEFTYRLIQKSGVAVVPGSGFFSHPELGRLLVHFCFSKTNETLQSAKEKLVKLKEQ